MRKIEKNGLVCVAEERVPASYLEFFVDGLCNEDIEDIKKELGEEYNVTEDWDMYINEIKDAMEDLIAYEAEDIVKEIEAAWVEVKEKLGKCNH